MLNCYQFKNHLSRYLDHEISLKQREEFEDHLKSCPHCQQLLAQITKNHQIMHQLPPVQVSDNFYFQLRNRILADRYAQKQTKSFPLLHLQRIPSYAYGFALALVAIIIGIVVLNWQETESPPNQLPATLQSRIQQPPARYAPATNPDRQTTQAPSQVASSRTYPDGDSLNEAERQPAEQTDFQDKIKAVKDQR